MYCLQPSARMLPVGSRPAPAACRCRRRSRPSRRSSRRRRSRYCSAAFTASVVPWSRTGRPRPTGCSRSACPAARSGRAPSASPPGTLGVGRRGRRIVGIGARDDVEHVGEIRDRARHRAAEVRQPDQRHDAGAALEAVGAAQRHQALRARRGVERVAGLRSQRARRQVRRHRAGRAAARRERRLRRVEHVPHLSPRVVGVVAAGRVLLERRLADDHRAGLAQPGDLEGVVRRAEAREREAAVGGRHVVGVVEVLDRDRDAQQRARLARLRAPRRRPGPAPSRRRRRSRRR